MPEMSNRMLVLVLALAAGSARADTDLFVLAPTQEATVPAKFAAKVKQAIAKGGLPVGDKAIDATCAADSGCVVASAQADAKAAVSITVALRRGGLGLNILLVDVGAKELIAKRELVIAERRLAADLVPALRKLVDEGRLTRSKELFDQASKHYSLGEYTQALELYRRAYRIKELPEFLFNIAQCHRKLGQHKDAMQMYQSYLVGVPDAENKKLVESLIEESKQALAAEQALADKRATEASRLESERIAADKKKSEDARKAKEAIAEAERRKAEVARIEAEREREREKLYDRHPARTWAIIGGSVGAAAAITGGIFAFRARSAQSSFDDAGCGDRDQVLDAEALATCEADRDRGESSARISNVLLASGGAVLAAALVVFVIDPGNIERPERARAGVVVAPSSVKLVVRW